MCLAVPGRIETIEEKGAAKVDFGGVKRKVFLDLLPEARVGDYVIVHAGFAIELLNEKEAKETLALFKEISKYEVS